MERDFWLSLDLLKSAKDHYEFVTVRDWIRNALHSVASQVTVEVPKSVLKQVGPPRGRVPWLGAARQVAAWSAWCGPDEEPSPCRMPVPAGVDAAPVRAACGRAPA